MWRAGGILNVCAYFVVFVDCMGHAVIQTVVYVRLETRTLTAFVGISFSATSEQHAGLETNADIARSEH